MAIKVITAGLVLGLTLMAAQPAEAVTYAGQNGRVAYVAANGDVWTVGQGGQGAQRLPLKNVKELAWSPDGRSLAFVESQKNGSTRIGVLMTRSGEVRYVTHRPDVSDATPVWSYGGSVLAFVRTQYMGGAQRSAVYVADILRNDAAKNISGWSARSSYRAPSWEPGDRRMVYEEFSATNARLVIRDIASGRVHELVALSDVTASSRASWSPSGKKILFNDSDGQVYTIWSDGTHRSVISDGDSYMASWSPDGNRIAFLEDFSGDYVSISGPDGSISYVPFARSGYDALSALVWSPDGTKVGFVAHNSGGAYDLFAATVDSQPVVSLYAHMVGGVLAWQSK